MGSYVEKARENHVKKKVEEGNLTMLRLLHPVLSLNPKPLNSLRLPRKWDKP